MVEVEVAARHLPVEALDVLLEGLGEAADLAEPGAVAVRVLVLALAGGLLV